MGPYIASGRVVMVVFGERFAGRKLLFHLDLGKAGFPFHQHPSSGATRFLCPDPMSSHIHIKIRGTKKGLESFCGQTMMATGNIYKTPPAFKIKTLQESLDFTHTVRTIIT